MGRQMADNAPKALNQALLGNLRILYRNVLNSQLSCEHLNKESPKVLNHSLLKFTHTFSECSKFAIVQRAFKQRNIQAMLPHVLLEICMNIRPVWAQRAKVSTFWWLNLF